MKKNLGFTLVEILVATGVLAIISMVVTQILFSTTRSNNKTEILKEVKQSGDFAIDYMTRMIRSSQTITSNCANPAVITNDLTILNKDGLTTTFSCLSDAGNLRLASTSATSTSYLSSNNLTVSQTAGICSLRFSCKTVGGVPRIVSINFGLEQKSTSPDQSEKAKVNFGTSVTLRN